MAIESSDILKKKVSFQNRTWDSISNELTIQEVLDTIKSDKLKLIVEKLRSLLEKGNKEAYTAHKRNLPSVTFCGTFQENRKKENLKTYNSIIVLDIDNLTNEEFLKVKKYFINDEYVFSFWESPSQQGVKGLVALEFDFEINKINIDKVHKIAFYKLSSYFKDKYDILLDNSGNDTTRLCFYSYDPNLILKNKIISFKLEENDLEDNKERKTYRETPKIHILSDRDALFNPTNRNKSNDRYIISSIIRYLKKNNLSITFTYEDWYKVAMAIANTFTYEIGEKYFLNLSSLDASKYNEINCKNFLMNCYESRKGSIKFNTIVYLANCKGYKTTKQRGGSTETIEEILP